LKLLKLFLISVALIAWASAAYSMLQARKYRRPGRIFLIRENLTEAGQPYLRRANWSVAIFAAVIAVMMALDMIRTD